MDAMHSVRLIAAVAAMAFSAQILAAPPVPAKIVGTGETADSVGYVTSSGTTSLDANVGRWDTPYPYPDTGQYAPGLQPEGYSGFYVDVDVNDGGKAVFSYLMQTWDAGIYDWYDISLQTPTGEIMLVSKLGKPGTAYGTYWSSPRVSMAQPLDEWKNQRVRFVFKVMQDGWGDQTQGQLTQFKLASCPVPALTELTDPLALHFEAGNTINTGRLTAATQTGLNCIIGEVARLGGNFRLNSAWRPVPYQAHLREVWDRWNSLRNNQNQDCSELKSTVRAEYTRHGLQDSQRPAPGNENAPHARGLAIDASISGLPAGQTRDTVAATCAMHRPWPVRDPPHYQPR